MPYEVLEKEIKTLSETDIAEVSDFIVYLKLKDRFADFENQKKLDIEKKLDEADSQAASTEARLTHEEVFSGIRSKIKAS